MRLPGVLLAVIGLLAANTTAADADPTALTVGGQAVPASEVTRRLGLVPAYQLLTLGSAPAEIRRRFTDSVLVPELLYAVDAEQRKLGSVPGVRLRLRSVLQQALVEDVRREVAATPIPDLELRAYYDAHLDDFRAPERIRVWRILVDDAELARRLIHEARGVAPEKWRQLTRDNSVDTATKMRAGLLGFVLPDGRTDVPQLQVDPALYAAAAKVKDGELVPEPVPEGPRFAVVSRRGTLPATAISFEGARDSIRELLVRQRVQANVDSLRATLRRGITVDASPLDGLANDEPPPPIRARPPRPLGSATPAPSQTERGLR